MDLHAVADSLTVSSSRHSGAANALNLLGLLVGALSIALYATQIISVAQSTWLSASASILICLGFFFGRRAQGRNVLARFMRRRALLADAIGYEDALEDGLDAAADSLDDRRLWTAASRDAKDYYASSHDKGIERLRQNMIESAVWTEKLYRAARTHLVRRTAFNLTCAFVMTMAIILTKTGAIDRAVLLQLLSVSLVFAGSAEQIDSIGKWSWASAETRRVREGLAPVTNATHLNVVVWVAFADYAVITSVAPAIPQHLFKRHREQLSAVADKVLNH
jgi:hypothetical protein